VRRSKTRIICKVKLNFMQANEYLDHLTSLGLLSKEKGKYTTTEKGRQFITSYNQVGEIMGASAVTDRHAGFALFCVC
jgi:predicted transcriptional regulator